MLPRKSRFSESQEPEAEPVILYSGPPSSSSKYEYLNKMFQPPKGTKFPARLPRKAPDENTSNDPAKSILTPGLKEEYERLEKQKLIPNDPFAAESIYKDGSPVSENEGTDEEDQGSVDGKQSSRGQSSSRDGRHGSRSKPNHHRHSHSREYKRSKSRSRGESSSNHQKRSRRSKSKSRDRRRSRERRRSRSRDKSRNKSNYNRSYHGKQKRSPTDSKPKHWSNGKPFAGKGNKFPNGPKPANQKGWKNAPQQQQQNTRRFAVIDKLEKLNMLDRFIETAKIYEEVIDPAEKAKAEGREKTSPVKPKTVDDAAIAKTLESNLVCAKNLTNVTSQKRLVSLMSTMRFYLNQMNVESQKYNIYFDSYLKRYCSWMGWDSISSEAALLVDLKDKVSDPLKDFTYSMDEPYKCSSCSLVYPDSKFSCLTCSQLFTNLPELFAHEYSTHGRLVQSSFCCFVCQQQFGGDPVTFSRHYSLEHLCKSGHSECAVGCKTLIIGSSYLDLENHSAAHHKCKICGDLLGDSLRDHLSFFHHTVAEKDYLPEVFFEPVIDPDLAKLNDLLNTFEDVKKQNPSLFLEDGASSRNPPVSTSSAYEISQESGSHQNRQDIIEVNPIPNVHRYLTTKDSYAVTSLNVSGSQPARKTFEETNDVDSFYCKFVDSSKRTAYPSQAGNCIYNDSSRDPRLKSEFYNWKIFFSRFNQERQLGEGSEISLDRLFNNSSDLEPSRSDGLLFDLKTLNYSESSPLKRRRDFDDFIEVGRGGIPEIPVTFSIEPFDRNVTHDFPSPITRKPKEVTSYRLDDSDEETDVRVKRSRYTVHNDVIDVGDSFDDVTDWDPKYDRIIRNFSDRESSSRSRQDSLADGFVVSNVSTPRKSSEYTRSHSSYSSPQKYSTNRDPRLQSSSSLSRDSESDRHGASSFRASESWDPREFRGMSEKEKMAKAMELLLSKQ